MITAKKNIKLFLKVVDDLICFYCILQTVPLRIASFAYIQKCFLAVKGLNRGLFKDLKMHKIVFDTCKSQEKVLL